MSAETTNQVYQPGPSRLRKLTRQFGLIRESKVGLVGVIIIAFWVLVALFAGLLSPYDPNTSVNDRFLPAFSEAPLNPGAYQDLSLVVQNLPAGASLSAGTATDDGWVIPGRDVRNLRLTVPADTTGTIELATAAIAADDTIASGVLSFDIDAARAALEADETEVDPYAAYGQSDTATQDSYTDAYGQSVTPADDGEADLSLPISLTEALPVSFILGTDHLGRDILSRIIYGSRTVLIYAPIATFCAYLVGILLGLAAGYYRG